MKVAAKYTDWKDLLIKGQGMTPKEFRSYFIAHVCSERNTKGYNDGPGSMTMRTVDVDYDSPDEILRHYIIAQASQERHGDGPASMLMRTVGFEGILHDDWDSLVRHGIYADASFEKHGRGPASMTIRTTGMSPETGGGSTSRLRMSTEHYLDGPRRVFPEPDPDVYPYAWKWKAIGFRGDTFYVLRDWPVPDWLVVASMKFTSWLLKHAINLIGSLRKRLDSA